MGRIIALHCAEKPRGEGIKGKKPPEHLSRGQGKYCVWLPPPLLPASPVRFSE